LLCGKVVTTGAPLTTVLEATDLGTGKGSYQALSVWMLALTVTRLWASPTAN